MERQEKPEVIITDESDEAMFDDIPPGTQLRIEIKKPGDGASYVEYERPDGTTRRVATKPGGGEIRIRTDRV